jgi:hypothetical protein
MGRIKNQRRSRNNQQQIVDYLDNNPFRTEKEIQIDIWGYYIDHKKEASKKYADILRRALYSNKIKRVRMRCKVWGETRKYWRYYTETGQNVFNN